MLRTPAGDALPLTMQQAFEKQQQQFEKQQQQQQLEKHQRQLVQVDIDAFMPASRSLSRYLADMRSAEPASMLG